MSEATFDYINARGALDKMSWWHGPHDTKSVRGKGGRPRMVSTFEAFVLFLYMFRNGLASNMASYEEWWGMSEPTLRRLYITFLHAVATIMGRHQSWPTY